jgi:hypothetical protein
MAWSSGTWSRIIATSIDICAAGIFWRKYGCTVSALCGLELRKTGGIWSLRVLGRFLNWIQPGHCESAIVGDRARASAALQLLVPLPPTSVSKTTPISESPTFWERHMIAIYIGTLLIALSLVYLV